MADEIRREHHTEQNSDHPYERRMAWGWWVFAVIALFYLLTEHLAHLFGILPYLLLLACPLMHFFMHGRHGEHGHTHGNEEDKK
ncbi:MAG: hypothetical protein BGO63_07590 [Candidatus Accumulibacter sp. 66-26]|nr:DUF2933 domain-containing protein [Accumulibacter sp.]OJW46570.1 MAG: hypothetical protein BGO63_07590 [Candidatus Accumulibacter sp. 66-26]